MGTSQRDEWKKIAYGARRLMGTCGTGRAASLFVPGRVADPPPAAALIRDLPPFNEHFDIHYIIVKSTLFFSNIMASPFATML